MMYIRSFLIIRFDTWKNYFLDNAFILFVSTLLKKEEFFQKLKQRMQA